MKTKKTIAKENSKTGKYHLGKIIDLMRDQNQIGGG